MNIDIGLRERWLVSRPVLRYGLVVVFVASAVLLSVLFHPLLPTAFVYLFLAAVMASGWLGGAGPGLFAVAFAAVALDYFFMPPLYTLGISREAWPYLLPFLLSALAAAWISSTRKLAGEAEAAKARLAVAVAQAGDGIVITDTSGNIQYANPAFTNLTGYKAEEVMGKNPRLLKSGRQDASYYENLWKTILAGRAWHGQLTNRRKDGTLYTEEMTITPVRDSSGRVTNFIAVKRDITERRAEEVERAEQSRLAALGADIGAALNGESTLHEGLQWCAEAIVRHLDAAFARIWTLDETTQVLELEASAGMYTHIDGAHGRVPVGKFTIGRIAQDGKPHLSNDVLTDAWLSDPEWARQHGMVAFAGYPLIMAGKPIGVIAAFARRPLSEAVIQDLALIASRIAQFVKRKRAEGELRRLNRALRTISDCNQAMVRATDECQLLEDVCEILVGPGGYRMAWVGFVEHDEGKSVRSMAHAGHEDGYLNNAGITWADTERGQGPMGIAIRTGKPSVAQGIRDDPRMAGWREVALKNGYASSIALPLHDGEQVFGALAIYSPEPGAFDEQEVKLLTELSNDLTYGIQTLRTRAERMKVEKALGENESLIDRW